MDCFTPVQAVLGSVRKQNGQAIMVTTFNLGSQETEAGGSMSSSSGLQNKIQDSQNYTEKSCLKKQKQKNITTKPG